MSSTKKCLPYKNIHSDQIDKCIARTRKSTKYDLTIIDSTHEQIVSAFSTTICTNIIQKSCFTSAYLKKHPCSNCGAPSTERCHGIGEERPVLLARACAKIYPDISIRISLKAILIAFLEEHKNTKFTFMCTDCHRKDTKALMSKKPPQPKADADVK